MNDEEEERDVLNCTIMTLILDFAAAIYLQKFSHSHRPFQFT